MKNNIYITINHSKRMDYGEQAVTNGFVDKSSELTIKKVIQKELNGKYKEIKSFGGKIEALFADINNSGIIEMIFLDLESKTYRNLVKKLQENDLKTMTMKNVVIVAKKDRTTENLINWNNFNSVALFTNLIITKKNEGKWVVHFELSRIEFLNVAFSRRHPTIDLKDYKIINIEKSKVENIEFLDTKAINDEMDRNYRRPVEIFNNNSSRLELKKNSEFIFSFMKFMQSIKDESITLFSFNEVESDLESKVTVNALISQENIKMLGEKGNINISNTIDTSMKFDARIDKDIKKVNFLETSTLAVEEIDTDIEINASKINELQIKQNELILEKDNFIFALEQQRENINHLEIDLKNSRNELNVSTKEQKNIEILINKSDMAVKKLSDNIRKNEGKKEKLLDKLDKENKPSKSDKGKPKKEKKGNIKNIKSIKLEIEILEKDTLISENKISELKESLKTPNKNLKSLENEISNIKKIIADKEKEIAAIKKEINAINKNISRSKNEISKVLNIIENRTDENKLLLSSKREIEANIKWLERHGYEIYEISFSRKSKDGQAKIKFYMEPTTKLSNVLLNKEWIMSTFDFGLFTNIRRFKDNIQNLKKGYYKNPYLALALDKPSELPELIEIDGSYNLNEKQELALKKTLSTDDIAYIQGPPGTGKTQTIASAANEIINKNGNVLVSSSTHAAITNFFERLDSQERKNPNIFMLKYSYGKQEAQYGESDMFNRFLASMDANVVTSSKIDFLSLIERVEALDDEYVRKNKFHSLQLSKSIKNSLNRNNILEFEYVLDQVYDIDAEDYDDKDEVFEEILSIDKKTKGRKKHIVWKEIMDDISAISNQDALFIFNKETAINYIKSEQSKVKTTNFSKTYQNFLNFRKDKENSDEISNFKNEISAREMINAIGITTTSRKSFTFNGKTNKIFIEYPIDLVIIDEVSKSVTPEIISNSFLAKKVLLTGDYRQLPPGNNIDQSLLEQFFESEYSTKFNNEFFNSKNAEDFIENIDKMFSNSLFKNQIKSIKENTTNRAYEFLNTQYRFTNEIMEAVNISYDDNEKLKMPTASQQNNWMRISYKTKSGIQNSSFDVIDTSFLSQGFIDKIHNSKSVVSNKIKDLKVGDRAFDQKSSIFNTRLQKSARFNEYNSYVVGQIVESIIDSNKFIKNEQIGVIAMTRSQTNIIKEELKRMHITGIKVDTVDNFQGSERDIILVDLVRASGMFDKKGTDYLLSYPKTRNLDFYKKIERLNVAISRARSKLIVIGAFEDHLVNGVESIVERNGREEMLKTMEEIQKFGIKNGGYKQWK